MPEFSASQPPLPDRLAQQASLALHRRFATGLHRAEPQLLQFTQPLRQRFSSSLISFLKPCPIWCHRQNVLPYTGLPQCDEHVEEGSVRKEMRSKPFVGARFRG